MAAHKQPDLENYKALFKEFDKDGDGSLTIGEMKNLLLNVDSKLTDSQVAEYFPVIDRDGDKKITFSEFCKGLEELLNFMEIVKEVFQEADTSGNGFIDRNELKALLKKLQLSFTDAEVERILKDADKNGDNQISYAEFIKACT